MKQEFTLRPYLMIKITVYLSGGLKPATETSRILTYPPLIEAGVFPTEINGNIMWKLTEFVLY